MSLRDAATRVVDIIEDARRQFGANHPVEDQHRNHWPALWDALDGLVKAVYEPPALFDDPPPEPTTTGDLPLVGRVANDHPDTSREAAMQDRRHQHDRILGILIAHPEGINASHVAAEMGTIVANQANTRLGELWEAGKAAILRERGRCVYGVCHPADKPNKVRHLPTDPCVVHGAPITGPTVLGKRGNLYVATRAAVEEASRRGQP
jgi:hypothetical protein